VLYWIAGQTALYVVELKTHLQAWAAGNVIRLAHQHLRGGVWLGVCLRFREGYAYNQFVFFQLFALLGLHWLRHFLDRFRKWRYFV